MNQKISEVLATLTDRPGVYMMKSADGAVIYVGKAKNLKNRVKSYFLNAGGHDVKTEALVSNIDEIEYIITASEHEAFILENSLIKKHRPRYNIMFKDDKTYPFIKLTVNEEWPRAVLSRRVAPEPICRVPFTGIVPPPGAGKARATGACHTVCPCRQIASTAPAANPVAASSFSTAAAYHSERPKWA